MLEDTEMDNEFFEEFFEEVDVGAEFLDHLAQHIDQGHFQYLQDNLYNVNTSKIREKLRDQVGDAEDIFAEMSRDGYYHQEVELSPHLSATFRTIPSTSQDEAMEYAREQSENTNEYGRVLSRRRLAYGLIRQNDRDISEPINGSLYDLGNDAYELLEEMADNAMLTLNLMPDQLVTRLSQCFGVWESLVRSRIKEADHTEIVKN